MGIHFICFIQKCKVFQPCIETKYGFLEDIEICKAIFAKLFGYCDIKFISIEPAMVVLKYR